MNFREKKILEIVYNKNVLDIGSLGQTNEYSLWDCYKEFKPKSLIGVDLPDSPIDSKEIFGVDKTYISTNEKIVFGNMETLQLDEQFDVVVAGDVIEHVSNQGLFLENISKHLVDNGKLIISTPNSKWPTVFLKPNATHTLWHDKYTLKRILDLSGFTIKEFHYYFGNKPKYNLFLRPFVWRQGMLVVCEKNT